MATARTIARFPSVRLTLTAAATYEIGRRETDHGIPLEPYPDP